MDVQNFSKTVYFKQQIAYGIIIDQEGKHIFRVRKDSCIKLSKKMLNSWENAPHRYPRLSGRFFSMFYENIRLSCKLFKVNGR